ncbi:MAG: thymidylate kinase [Candidatus Hepatoplasma vulgare]|nr:MAG: thymidylate kinase [Candidatus Hepatoplasma sp.]
MSNLNKLFFTFEGIEGSGKSTIINIVYNEFLKRGYDIFLTREPGGNNLIFAEKIRKVILEDENITPLTELFLFEASRVEHLDKIIIPNLKQGKIVLCDRFADSTLVYQKSKGIDIRSIEFLNKIATNNFFPTKVFILDIEPEIALNRLKINKNREINKFDKENIFFHKKIRDEYLKLVKKNKEKYILINANQEKEKVSEDIIKILEKVF